MKLAARIILAVFLILAGANHFLMPAVYLSMIPPWVPYPDAANFISGSAEILGGFGLLFPPTRRLAGWGLIALLIAVFPANLHVALQGRMADFSIPPWVLWARLPVQLLFIAWVAWVSLAGGRDTKKGGRD